MAGVLFGVWAIAGAAGGGSKHFYVAVLSGVVKTMKARGMSSSLVLSA